MWATHPKRAPLERIHPKVPNQGPAAHPEYNPTFFLLTATNSEIKLTNLVKL